ncbi:MAG: hypothetical protein N2C14_25965 [Planctomycetales bacterium]
MRRFTPEQIIEKRFAFFFSSLSMGYVAVIDPETLHAAELPLASYREKRDRISADEDPRTVLGEDGVCIPLESIQEVLIPHPREDWTFTVVHEDRGERRTSVIGPFPKEPRGNILELLRSWLPEPWDESRESAAPNIELNPKLIATVFAMGAGFVVSFCVILGVEVISRLAERIGILGMALVGLLFALLPVLLVVAASGVPTKHTVLRRRKEQ